MERKNDSQLEELLTETLTAEVASRRKSGFTSREEFELWLRQGEMKQRKRRQRRIGWGLAAAAAVFVCASFLLSSDSNVLPASIVSPWEPTASYAGSDSSSSPDITEENGSIVIGGDGNGNVGEWTATFTSYEDLPEKYQKEIIWFEELPEGYVPFEATISKNNCIIEFVTRYKTQDKEKLVIKKVHTNNVDVYGTIINQYDELISLSMGEVFIKRTSQTTMYVYSENNVIIHIIDENDLEIKIIEDIITSIKTDPSM